MENKKVKPTTPNKDYKQTILPGNLKPQLIEPIPAAFFDRFCLWRFWSSSTLPRLVCLAYVRGFYFLFCCVEVSSVVLCLLCCVVLRCVVIHYVVLSCIVLRSVVLCLFCCVALRCVVIRCVTVVLYLLSYVALCCGVIRCLVLCCVVDKFSISSILSVKVVH